MSETEPHGVLRCGECNKPFDKQSTLKRHGYYCRSRRALSTPRSRSCVSCAGSKARCDNARPKCSRCVTKDIECRYPTNVSRTKEARNEQSHAPRSTMRKTAPSAVPPNHLATPRDTSSDEVTANSALTALEIDFTNFDDPFIGWHGLEDTFTDFLAPSTTDEATRDISPRLSAWARRTTSPLADRTANEARAAIIPSPLMMSPSVTTARLLVKRGLPTGPQRIAKLIHHTLRSYPLMMLGDNALPPFIHPRLLTDEVEQDCTVPLTNCISLVHMISSGVRGCRKLFWRNVRLECERLCEEHATLNKWQLLAAMQALSIYILIRLDEGETDHNDLDFLMVATLTVLVRQMAIDDTACKTQSSLYNDSTTWKDWLFVESMRRLSLVSKVVNMLIYFEPAALCDLQRDIFIAPLPSRKQLWEASDEGTWHAQCQQEHRTQAAYGLGTNGDLLRIDPSKCYAEDAVILHEPPSSKKPSVHTGNWEEWCSGMDGLGGLVMLAASLLTA